MGARPGGARAKASTTASPGEHRSTAVDTPASMERLLVPTKSWAQKLGINKSPDLREQRRLGPREAEGAA